MPDLWVIERAKVQGNGMDVVHRFLFENWGGVPYNKNTDS